MTDLSKMTENEIWQEINELIASAPPEYNLDKLQWKCDMIRQKYGDNHTGALVEIQSLMLQSAGRLNEALEELNNVRPD